MCQKAEADHGLNYDTSMLSACPGKVPGLTSPDRDRFELRRTRALKQVDEYLHAFRAGMMNGSNTGSTVRHHCTRWCTKEVLLAATSAQYATWAGRAFGQELSTKLYCAPFDKWHEWRGTGLAPPLDVVPVEPVQVDDDEMDASAPPASDLFGIEREKGTQEHGSGACRGMQEEVSVPTEHERTCDEDNLCAMQCRSKLHGRSVAGKPTSSMAGGDECKEPRRKRRKRRGVLDLTGIDGRWESKVKKGPKTTKQQQRRGSGGNSELVTRTVARD